MTKEDFPGSLGTIAEDISKAAEQVDEKYKFITGIFNQSLLLIRELQLLNNPLGWLYREWHNSVSGSAESQDAWHRFIDYYYGMRVGSSDGKVIVKDYPGVAVVNLPTISCYQRDGGYDLAKIGDNARLQAGFARTLGVLQAEESWEDMIKRPSAIQVNGNREEVRWFITDPKILLYIKQQETNKIEFPFIDSEMHPGVVVRLGFESQKNESGLSIEESIREERAFVFASLFVSTDLFFDCTANRLQTPEGKALFLSDLSQMFLKS